MDGMEVLFASVTAYLWCFDVGYSLILRVALVKIYVYSP